MMDLSHPHYPHRFIWLFKFDPLAARCGSMCSFNRSFGHLPDSPTYVAVQPNISLYTTQGRIKVTVGHGITGRSTLIEKRRYFDPNMGPLTMIWGT